MAKSARASSKKVNHTKLRARVFGPAEKARAERIHAKLLDTINQPKPQKTAMDVDESRTPHYHHTTTIQCTTNSPPAATTATEAKDHDAPKGSSFLTASIPRSLSDVTTTTTSTTTKQYDPAEDERALRNLCFHLGLCSDIVGFNHAGRLQFAFDPLPPHWLSENQGLTTIA